MGKYINNGKGVLVVLGVKYKKGHTFSLSSEDEKKISPAFLKQYSVDNNKKKTKAERREEIAKDKAEVKADAEKEAEDKEKAESK